jgi:hypothetical protein
MSAGKIVFACGATIDAKDTSRHHVGDRMMVFTTPQQKHQRPTPPDRPELRMNCLILCPCSVKASGRKTEAGWFEDGAHGRLVTCKIAAVQPT